MREARITEVLKSQLSPDYLEVINQSNGHQVAPGSETHFRVFIVSSAFREKSKLQRHQLIYQILKTELDAGLHALALQTLTPEEYAAGQQKLQSPDCVHR